MVRNRDFINDIQIKNGTVYIDSGGVLSNNIIKSRFGVF